MISVILSDPLTAEPMPLEVDVPEGDAEDVDDDA